MRHGFDLGYKTWVHHGEPDLPPPPPVIDNTRQPQMSDMIALLNDLSLIPADNELIVTNQGDMLRIKPGRHLYVRCALIYPPALFDIMIHLVIHLPLEALKGGPIRPRWMFPFERYMKKLKGYVRNKAKPEGSIAEGYVAEEALTFSSHYFRDVTTKFIDLTDDPDIIHFDNSSDLPLSTSLNDLDNATLHIDGQSTEVDARNSDDEDNHINDDDDGVDKMSADVARSHGGDGGGEDRPPPHHVPSGCMGCFANQNEPDIIHLGGVKTGRKTRERTRNQVLKDAVAANKGRPIEIGFEDRADNKVVPTGPYSTQWGNYFGEMIRSIPLYYHSWQKVPAGDKARLMATLGSTYNLEPHMRSERWPRIEGYIQAQFGKSYNTNKATLKREHWIRDPETGAYDLDRIRRGKPDEYTDDEWEKYINFWNDPANAQRAETNRLNRSKSTVVSRHGSRSIPLTRHLMKMTSATQEEPSEIDTFYRLHTVNGVFQDPEALRMYDRMRELEATGEHTTAEINAMVRGGKLRGHIPGVGPVMPGYVRSRLSYTAPVDRSRDVDFMMR
ncbi:F-box domain containing protein [Tanacetum coccineum]